MSRGAMGVGKKWVIGVGRFSTFKQFEERFEDLVWAISLIRKDARRGPDDETEETWKLLVECVQEYLGCPRGVAEQIEPGGIKSARRKLKLPKFDRERMERWEEFLADRVVEAWVRSGASDTPFSWRGDSRVAAMMRLTSYYMESSSADVHQSLMVQLPPRGRPSVREVEGARMMVRTSLACGRPTP